MCLFTSLYASVSICPRVISATSHPSLRGKHFQNLTLHIFKIHLTWWREKQRANSKQNIFIFTVATHVCPPLRLTNTDIRLVVCTAWVMWHQSDLQNSRGGAINHIGSGINHCVEDIFCHRCPLTITLCKTLARSLSPSIHSSIAPSATIAIGLLRKKEKGCPFHHSFKMQVKVYRVACVLSTQIERRQWRHTNTPHARFTLQLLW